MPELPEVETIKKTLEHFVLNSTIQDVQVYWGNIIKRPDDSQAFKLLLIGQTIQKLSRKGKFLLFYLDDYVLVSHLRMEGKYKVVPKEEEMMKHTHVVFSFTNGKELRYNDVRKFGTMHLYPIGEEFSSPPLSKIGPEPFESAYSVDYLEKRFAKTNRLIKSVLLDQTIVTGLGNIYVDETLFQAGIHPQRRANTLDRNEIESIYQSSIETLTKAVQLGGTTIRSYVNSQGEMGMFQQELFVYGQEGEPCKKCTNEIIKIKAAGRGTHICTHCQPK